MPRGKAGAEPVSGQSRNHAGARRSRAGEDPGRAGTEPRGGERLTDPVSLGTIAGMSPGPVRIPRKRLLRRVLPATAAGAFFIHVAFFLLLAPFILLLRWWSPPVNSLMLRRALLSRDRIQAQLYVPLSRLPASVPKMFIHLEDRGFYAHGGIDFAAMKTAHRRNRQAGRLAYGGSTITQQLARTLFLAPDKNYLRKYLEALVSVEMELLLSKDRILELYVNHIEWGKGVFGIGRAARVYYKKDAEKLSIDQFRRLAAVIPSPRRFTVKNLERHLGLRQRYLYLVQAFSG